MKLVLNSALLLTLLAGCKEAPKPLSVYTVTITGREADFINDIKYPGELSSDTIMAVDDTTAYQKGLFAYYGRLYGEKVSNNAFTKAESFSVVDLDGVDIGTRLGASVTDSLEEQVKKLAARSGSR